MNWLFSISGIALVIWGVSIFLAAAPVPRELDAQIGLSVPKSGSSVWRFTEGYAISRFDEHGVNPVVAKGVLQDKKIYLYGDSYIEALQVSDNKKPDAVLSCNLGVGVIGVGRSGTGLPSSILHARAYEQAFGLPKCHIFFVANVRDDVFNDKGGEYVWDEKGLRTRTSKPSALQMCLTDMINRFHMNGLLTFYRVYKEFKARQLKFWCRKQIAREEDEGGALQDRLNFLMKELRRVVKAPCVIVYCPGLPRLESGNVALNDTAVADAECLATLARENGIGFLNVSPALIRHWEDHGMLARGFANLGGPGNGHLNEEGIRAVFEYVAEYVKGHYDL